MSARSIAIWLFSACLIFQNAHAQLTDEGKRFQELKLKAESGDASAQYNLGFCYANGQGVEKNSGEALKWYRKAATAGEPAAEYEMALLYTSGEGVSPDLQEALNWFRRAAERG